MQKKYLIEVTIDAADESSADESQRILVSRSNTMAPITIGPGKTTNYQLAEVAPEPEDKFATAAIGILMVISGIIGAIIS